MGLNPKGLRRAQNLGDCLLRSGAEKGYIRTKGQGYLVRANFEAYTVEFSLKSTGKPRNVQYFRKEGRASKTLEEKRATSYSCPALQLASVRRTG